MANYVLVFKGGSMPETEEETQRVMAAWGAWYTGLGEAVHDSGNPFGPSMSVANDGSTSEGAASGLTGYVILVADSLTAAAEMAKGCPVLAGGAGSIEIYETFQIM